MRWTLLALVCFSLTLNVVGCGPNKGTTQLPTSSESLNEDGEEKAEKEE